MLKTMVYFTNVYINPPKANAHRISLSLMLLERLETSTHAQYITEGLETLVKVLIIVQMPFIILLAFDQ